MEMDELMDMLDFFFKKQVTIHIDTFGDSFYNGLIIEMHEKFLVINDRVVGETPVLFSEIKILERFKGI